ncbi:SurA N-terminal domain-containing protein [Consotaella aegiceratis]|uniref:SurA N-terminal domain-containing protein n=1 Tax=Consotaella aegiceratis TaxID=3097961 RepID=UPI002F3E57A1
MNVRTFVIRAALAGLLAAPLVPASALIDGTSWAASEVKVVVNSTPITSYAIRQRTAFLRLRHVSGNLEAAAEKELIDEALKKQEMRRRGITVPDATVDQAFAKFASDNKLTQSQLGQVLSQAGFSADAFKDYIRVQIGWGEAVRLHVRSEEQVSERDAVQRMLAQGGQKPSTTEYTLQQVIFVVPESERGTIPRRMQEANALRNRFTNCQSTYDFAKGLRDVTVRELGRIAQPELPSLWKDAIIDTPVGKATPPKQTDRGVEFIAVCDTRTVSDDHIAAMVYEQQDLEALGKQEPAEQFLKELRDKAQIVKK